MDFISDALFDGRRLRALTVVDNYTRECLAIEVDKGITGEQVTEVLESICLTRALPETIFCDNGLEFVSKSLDKWAYERCITLNFSRPGKPTDNAIIESFNGSFRDECLNTNWFLSLEDAQQKKSRLGEFTIMRVVLTCPWHTVHPRNSWGVSKIKRQILS
jgi:putative transposase